MGSNVAFAVFANVPKSTSSMAHMQDPQSTFNWGDIILFDSIFNTEDEDFVPYIGCFGVSNETVYWLSSDGAPHECTPPSCWNKSQ